MKKTFIIVFSILILWGCGNPKKADNVIKIGAILPLTGSASAYGIDCKKGIEMAISEINSKSTKMKYELVIEDDKTDPNQAVSATQKLISINKVKFIIGTVTSSSMLAISPIVEQNKVVLLSPSASNPKITEAGEYIFRNWISDNFEGKVMARYIYIEENFKEASVLYINNDYGNGLREVFKTEYQKLGGRVVFDEGFNQDQTDFKTLLSKIKISDSKVIFMPGYYKEMANILIQAKNINFNIPFRGTVTCEEPQLVKIAGVATNNIIYTIPYYNPNSSHSINKNFSNSFLKKYGSVPGIFAGHGYDAAYILIQAIEKSDNKTTAEVKNNILNTKTFIGVTGKTTFDSNGDVYKPVAIKKIENGRFVLIKVIDPDELINK
ncbi:MAG: ABC transporter substrate-binding protein [Bacteroidetes bacterium]|nr:ABC transporter substrate-binding protein [Bacteroidota bacterium]